MGRHYRDKNIIQLKYKKYMHIYWVWGDIRREQTGGEIFVSRIFLENRDRV